MAVRISGRNPYRMSVWWFFPPARFPTVGIAIPAVISANPDMIPARADGTMLTNTDRGTKLYYDLRMSRYYPKSKTKQRGKNQFSHFLLLRVSEQAYGRHRVSRSARGDGDPPPERASAHTRPALGAAPFARWSAPASL